ncbi:proliferation marker protein Ki-67-like isoform X2 [Limulus polyphemus]|uniref:Proliferation marker protein Ki-67-like isoform X2 n=1 Tax=Limulus polyphemus TaxID=6850 RepID=A0ABM1BG24_LIMPO|nr:proliferation marker protein Ki-67-like isoform X2 [Limulus polyphemus]
MRRNFRFEYPPNSIHRPYPTPEKDEHIPLNCEQATPAPNAASVMKSPSQIPAESVSPSKKKTSPGKTPVSRKKSLSKSPPSLKKVPEKTVTKSPKNSSTPSPKNIKKPGSSKKKSPKSGKVSVEKRKLSPNIDDYGTSTKKKRVSFGPVLSPEQFDINMPPSTPLKRGSFPSRRTSVPNYFGSPILTHFATLRKGRVSEVPRELKINEESPQKKSSSSPKRLSSENNQKENALSKKSSKSPGNKKMASPSIATSHAVSVNHLNESISKTLKVNTSLVQKPASVKGSKIRPKAFYASTKKRISMPNQLLKQKYESSMTKRRNSDSNIKRSTKNSHSLTSLREVNNKDSSDNSTNGPISVTSKNDKEIVCNKLKNLPNSHGRYKTKKISLTPKASQGASVSISKNSVEAIKKPVRNSRSPRTIEKRSSISLLYGVKSPQVKQILKARKVRSVSPQCIQEKKALKSSLLDITCNGNKQLSSSFNEMSLKNSQPISLTPSNLGLSKRVSSKTPPSLTSPEMGETITRSSAKKRMISPKVVTPVSKPATPSDSKKSAVHATKILTPLSNINKKTTPRVKTGKTPRKSPKTVNKQLWSEVLKKGLMQKGIVATKKTAKKLALKKSLKTTKNQVKSQTATPLKAPLLNSTGHADSPATIYITKKVKARIALTRKGRKTPYKNIIKQMKIGSKKSETPETSFTGVESLLKTPKPFSRRKSLNKFQNVNSNMFSSLSPDKLPNVSDDLSVLHKGKTNQSCLMSDFLNDNSLVKSDVEIPLKSNSRTKKLTPKQGKEKEEMSVRDILEYTNVTVNENDKLKSDGKTVVKKFVETPQRTPPACYINGEGIKEIVHTSSTLPNVDYRTVKGAKRLAQIPKSAPRALKRLVNTPQADYRNVEGIKRLFKTSRSGPKPLKRLVHTPQADYRNVKGIKRLVKTPKSNHKALKNLINTPQADYRNVEGIKRLVKTPRSEPKALKRLVNTPQADYRNVEGIKRLVRTPSDTPKADYSNTEGIKRLLRNPEKVPQSDYTDVEGVRELMKQRNGTPRNIQHLKQVKTPNRSPRASFSNLSGIHSLFKMPETLPEPDFTGLAEIFVTPEISKQSQTPASKKTKRTKIRHTPSADVILPSVLKQKVITTINDAAMKETEKNETSHYLTTRSTRRGEAEIISVKNKNQLETIGNRISSGMIDNEEQPKAIETPGINLSSTPKGRRGQKEQTTQDQSGNLVLSATNVSSTPKGRRGRKPQQNQDQSEAFFLSITDDKIKQTDTSETNMSNTPKGRRGRKPQQNQEQSEAFFLSITDNKIKQTDTTETNMSNTPKRRRGRKPQQNQDQSETFFLSAIDDKIKQTDTTETNMSNTSKGRRGRKPQQNQDQSETFLLSTTDDKIKQTGALETNISNTPKGRRSRKKLLNQDQSEALVLSVLDDKIKQTGTSETNISSTHKKRRGRKPQQDQDQSLLLSVTDDKIKQTDIIEMNISSTPKGRRGQKQQLSQDQSEILVLSVTDDKIKQINSPETNISNTPKRRRGRKPQQNQNQSENLLLSATDDKIKQTDKLETDISRTLKGRRGQKQQLNQDQSETPILSATDEKIKEIKSPQTNVSNTPKGRRGRKPKQNRNQSETLLPYTTDDKIKQTDILETNVSRILKGRRCQKQQLNQDQSETPILSATDEKIKQINSPETNVSNTPKGRRGRKPQQNQSETCLLVATDDKIKQTDTLETNVSRAFKGRRGQKQQLSQNHSETPVLSPSTDKPSVLNAPNSKAGFDKTPEFNIYSTSKVTKDLKRKKAAKDKSEVSVMSTTTNICKISGISDQNVLSTPMRNQNNIFPQKQCDALVSSAKATKIKSVENTDTVISSTPIKRKGRPKKTLNETISENHFTGTLVVTKRSSLSPDTKNISGSPKRKRLLESNITDDFSKKDSSVISVVGEVSKDAALKQIIMSCGRKLRTKEEDHVEAPIPVDQQVELTPKLRGRKRGRNQGKSATPEQKDKNIEKTQETSPTPAKKLKKMEEQVITPLPVSKKGRKKKFVSLEGNNQKEKDFQKDQNISNIITQTTGSAKQGQKKANNEVYKTVNFKGLNTDNDETLNNKINHAQKTNTRSRKRRLENSIDISKNVEELSSVSPKAASKQTVKRGKSAQAKSDLISPHSKKGNKRIHQSPEAKVEFDKIMQNDKSEPTVRRSGQRKNQTLQAGKKVRQLKAVSEEVPARKTRDRRVYESTESPNVANKDNSTISPETKIVSKTRSSRVGRKQVAQKNVEVDAEKITVKCDNIPNTKGNESQITSIKQEQEMSTQQKKTVIGRRKIVTVNEKSEIPVKSAKGQNEGRGKKIQEPSSSGKEKHPQPDLGIMNTTDVQIPLVKGRRGRKAQSSVKTSQASPTLKTRATRSSTRAIKSVQGGSKQ